jgi:hypothetical protein
MAKGNKAKAKPQEASASASEANAKAADGKAKQNNSTANGDSTAGSSGKIGAAVAGVKAAVTGNGSTDKGSPDAAASSTKKAKAKKSKSGTSGSWRKLVIGQKRMIFAIGIGAGLCVPATLQALGIVQVVDVEEMMTPITQGLDDTRAAVSAHVSMLSAIAALLVMVLPQSW